MDVLMSEPNSEKKTVIKKYLTQHAAQVALHIHPTPKIHQVVRWSVPICIRDHNPVLAH